MTNYRAELQRLVKAYDDHGGKWLENDVEALHQAVERARAYFAQSEPEELTEEEILQISDQFDINGTEDVTKGMPLDTFFDSYQPQQLTAFARAIIAADRATTQGVKK